MIVSFSLMVAMAIMVHSFRESFDRWLGEALPADLRLRVTGGNETRVIDEAQQRVLAGVEGSIASSCVEYGSCCSPTDASP